MKDFKEEISKNVKIDGIYCSEDCLYKNVEICHLFIEYTKYDWKRDKPKRCSECLYYFGREKK